MRTVLAATLLMTVAAPADTVFAQAAPVVGQAAPPAATALPTGHFEVTLAAKLTETSGDIPRGIDWRIFRPDADDTGKLPMVASGSGGTMIFPLERGTYLVHAAFGRAGATKRITVGGPGQREIVVLDAGGLKLDAILAGGKQIAPDMLKFSIFDDEERADGDRALIVQDVRPNTIVRLNAGIYHIVSTYGNVNAIIRSDIRVDAGKLTEATVEHRAAQVTLKLVRDRGGEAIADTSWSVLTDAGDVVRENVGPFASMVLAEGTYTTVARNRDRIYQRDFTVEQGKNQEVEVLTSENSQEAIPADDDSLD